jgi:phosphomannomutase
LWYLPTPALQYIVMNGMMHGVFITASHNPGYNGVKVIEKDGMRWMI